MIELTVRFKRMPLVSATVVLNEAAYKQAVLDFTGPYNSEILAILMQDSETGGELWIDNKGNRIFGVVLDEHIKSILSPKSPYAVFEGAAEGKSGLLTNAGEGGVSNKRDAAASRLPYVTGTVSAADI